MLKLGVFTILAQGFFADIIPIDFLIFITNLRGKGQGSKGRCGLEQELVGEGEKREG